MKKAMLLSATAILFLLISCKKEDSPSENILDGKTTEFLVNGNQRAGNYTLFSFEQGKEVPSSDSNSSKWDFGIRFETFIINSASSGPGNAYVQIANTPFNEITTGALPGYKRDTSATQRAIKGSEWYTYNSTTRVLSPISGKTFLFVTANSKYAKMEILRADPADDNGNPVIPPTRPTKIKYTLRYFYQKNGTPNFQ